MEIVYAGFGGQGVLTSGLVNAYLALARDYNVLWSPAYGGQMRGGKAYSLVKFEIDKQVAEPLMTQLDILVAMNQPSLDFVQNLKEGGILIYNKDIVTDFVPQNKTWNVYALPADTLARESGSDKSANMVAVGAVIAVTDYFDIDEAEKVTCDVFEKKGKAKLNETNIKALRKGYEFFAK